MDNILHIKMRNKPIAHRQNINVVVIHAGSPMSQARHILLCLLLRGFRGTCSKRELGPSPRGQLLRRCRSVMAIGRFQLPSSLLISPKPGLLHFLLLP